MVTDAKKCSTGYKIQVWLPSVILSGFLTNWTEIREVELACMKRGCGKVHTAKKCSQSYTTKQRGVYAGGYRRLVFGRAGPWVYAFLVD